MAEALTLPAAVARDFCERVLAAAGLSPEDGAACADLMVDTSLRGIDSHGLVALLPVYADLGRHGLGQGAAPLEVTRTGAVGVVDGNAASGPRAARLAQVVASELARESGVGAVTIRNLGYVGALGWTVHPAAVSGLIALAACNASAFVAPHGGREALHGTNPIAIAIPHEGEPLVLDMRTNAFHMADYWHAVRTGEPLPEGALRLEDGTPITTVAEIDERNWEGVVSLPLAGAKGYGLALAVDVLTAALATSPIGREVADTAERDGLAGFVLALDPAFFGDPQAFLDGVRRLAEQVHATTPTDAERPVRLPGERANAERRRRLEHGIPVTRTEWERMLDRLSDLGVAPPELVPTPGSSSP